MTGGLIQLVSQGVENIFLTGDPRITFFKVVYRRHTNFSSEQIPCQFSSELNFGKKSTCLISKQGDLVGPIHLVITLPAISSINLNKFTDIAWVKKIGFAIVKKVEIIMAGQVIDKQFGEWLNIWYELTSSRQSDSGYDKMIGNIDSLTNFSQNKDEYTLYIPLQFWFCKNPGLSLPLVCLQHTDVKINIELNELDKCLLVSPTHYINIINDFVALEPFEYIEQQVDGKVASGIFSHFDFSSKRLYYIKTSQFDFSSQSNDNALDKRNIKYFIKGKKTKSIIIPVHDSVTHFYNKKIFKNHFDKIHIPKCFLLVSYIFLDEGERTRFMKAKQDYLIEQVSEITEQVIESSNAVVKLGIFHPCKFLTWIVQHSYNKNRFNYTNSVDGKSIIKQESLQLNGRERISFREYQYFNYVQPYQIFRSSPPEGINLYSFSLFADKFQPSGSCNMSLMDNIQIKMKLDSDVSTSNPVLFRGYAVNYQILRIAHGLCAPLFV